MRYSYFWRVAQKKNEFEFNLIIIGFAKDEFYLFPYGMLSVGNTSPKGFGSEVEALMAFNGSAVFTRNLVIAPIKSQSIEPYLLDGLGITTPGIPPVDAGVGIKLKLSRKFAFKIE